MKSFKPFEKHNLIRQNKGITITALVIVIIVMLILAGISIPMLVRKQFYYR